VTHSDHRPRVVLAAEEAAGLRALQAMVKAGITPVAVLTSLTPDARRGSSVVDVAGKLGVELWPAERVKDASLGQAIRSLDVDLLLNVHSLFLVHADVVAAPRIGSFNLHPGPLPEYAGLNAPSWALFHREPEHAVTLHWMTPGIDTGAIAYDARFPLGDTDTGLSVSTRCVIEGIPLVTRLLDDATSRPHRIPSRAQDLARRRVFERRDVPHGGLIDWALTAREIDAFVRAADFYPLPSPWGHPLATIEGREVGVVRVQRTGRRCDEPPGTVDRSMAGVSVATGDEWLTLKRLKLNDRYVDPAKEQAS
jgi:methionyl-tRNA formyltransferase